VVAVPAIVAQQARRPAVGADQKIQVAVAIVIGVRRPARHHRPREIRAGRA